MSAIVDPAFPASKFIELIGLALQDENLKKKVIKQTNAVIVFTLKNKEGKSQSWTLDLKGAGTVSKGEQGKADITLILSDDHFAQLADGKANPQKLFMSGKLKVKGNVMKAASLETVMKQARAQAKL